VVTLATYAQLALSITRREKMTYYLCESLVKVKLHMVGAADRPVNFNEFMLRWKVNLLFIFKYDPIDLR